MEFKEAYKIGFKNGEKWEYSKRLLTKAELLELIADMLCYSDKISITVLNDE